MSFMMNRKKIASHLQDSRLCPIRHIFLFSLPVECQRCEKYRGNLGGEIYMAGQIKKFSDFNHFPRRWFLSIRFCPESNNRKN